MPERAKAQHVPAALLHEIVASIVVSGGNGRDVPGVAIALHVDVPLGTEKGEIQTLAGLPVKFPPLPLGLRLRSLQQRGRREEPTAMLIPISLCICKVFLIKGKKPILVDSGRPKDAAVIAAALRRHGVALSDLSLILHTHGHWDHCGSSARLREHTSAEIAIHHADAPMLRQGNNGILTPRNLSARLFKPLMDLSYGGTEPSQLIDDEFDLAPYGVSAKVLMTPGHTGGSISVLTSEGEIIVGDLLMGGFLGGRLFSRKPGMHYFAENVELLKESIRRVLDLAPTRIHTGHGGPLNPEDVARRFSN